MAALLRGEGVATERAGRLALAAMLSARHLEHPVDLLRVLEMALLQALAPAQIRDRLDPDDGLHLHALLLELENAGTSEAKLVHALQDLSHGREPRTGDHFLHDLHRALGSSAAATG